MEIRTLVKVFSCGDDVGEGMLFAILAENWLSGKSERSGKENRDMGGGLDGTAVKCGIGAVDGLDGFVVGDEFALEGLAVVTPEKNVGILVDACINEVKSSEAANVIEKVVEETETEGVQVEREVEAQKTASCLKKRVW